MLFYEDKLTAEENKRLEERFDRIMKRPFETGVYRELYRGYGYSICRQLNDSYIVFSFTGPYKNDDFVYGMFGNSSYVAPAITRYKLWKRLCQLELKIKAADNILKIGPAFTDSILEILKNENLCPEELQQGFVPGSDPDFEQKLANYLNEGSYKTNRNNDEPILLTIIKSVLSSFKKKK